MTIYFICLFIASFLAYLSQKYGYGKESKMYLFFAFLVMVFVAGLRSNSVGTDTNNYVGMFKHNIVSLFDVFSSKENIEPGYLILNYFARQLSGNYISLLSSVAIVVVGFFLISIYKYSTNNFISVFLFITLGSYTYFFNGARQGLAMAFYAMSIGPLIKGNFKKYLLWIFIAFLFHRTIIISLPIYFLFRLKFSFKYVFIISVMVALIFIFFQNLSGFGMDVLSERYAQYITRGSKGAQFLTLFYTGITITLLFIRSKILSVYLKEYDICLTMILLGTVIYILVYFLGLDVNILRVSAYFHIAFIFIWPIVFKNLYGSDYKIMVFLFFIIHLTFFYVYTNRMSNLVPYQFNPWISGILS